MHVLFDVYVLVAQAGEIHNRLYTCIGFQCLLYSFKVFRFLSISKKMSTLWLTLKMASGDLLSFGLG